MIKNYNKFNEGLIDKLKGYSDEEVWNNLKELGLDKALIKACKINFLYGVKKALEEGANYKAEFNKPFRNACDNGCYDVVKFFLDNYKINKVAIENGFHNSFAHGDKRITKLLNKYLNVKEGINDYLKGPNMEEVWKNLGFDEGFNSADEYFSYVFDNFNFRERPLVYKRWYDNGTTVINYNTKHEYIDCNLGKYIKVMEKIFGLTYDNCVRIITKVLKKELELDIDINFTIDSDNEYYENVFPNED